jgi:hypothetical protein
MADRRVFECTRCDHVGFLYRDPPRCRVCGSQTGVVRSVDGETANRMVRQQQEELLKQQLWPAPPPQ